MLFKRLFKDKYAGSPPENASVVRTLFSVSLVFRCVLASDYEGVSLRRFYYASIGPSVGRTVTYELNLCEMGFPG